MPTFERTTAKSGLRADRTVVFMFSSLSPLSESSLVSSSESVDCDSGLEYSVVA